MDTLNDYADRIHAATVAIQEAVEDQLSDSSEVSTIVALDTIDAAADALAAELAEAKARAARLQLERAERLAEAILGLCEGDANDIEFELDLYPLDLYDQTADFDAAPGDTNN